MTVTYDPTITLGTLVTLAAFLLSSGAFLFTLIKFHIGNVERFTRVETKVDALWLSFTQRRRGDDLPVSSLRALSSE